MMPQHKTSSWDTIDLENRVSQAIDDLERSAPQATDDMELRAPQATDNLNRRVPQATDDLEGRDIDDLERRAPQDIDVFERRTHKDTSDLVRMAPQVIDDLKSRATQATDDLDTGASKETDDLEGRVHQDTDNVEKRVSQDTDDLKKRAPQATDNLEMRATHATDDLDTEASKDTDAFGKTASEETNDLDKRAPQATDDLDTEASNDTDDFGKTAPEETNDLDKRAPQATDDLEGRAPQATDDFEGSVPQATDDLERRAPQATDDLEGRASQAINDLEGRALQATDDLKRRTPQAILIGAAKSGTYALMAFLDMHPYIVAKAGDLPYFDKNFEKGTNWFRDKMPLSHSNQITMSKFASYFFQEEVPERIYSYNSSVKLLLIIRDPIDRALSNYAQGVIVARIKKLKKVSFEEQVTMEGSNEINMTNKNIIRGLYANYLPMWLKRFPRNQLHIIDGDMLIKNPYQELHQVEQFLSIPTYFDQKMFNYSEKKKFYCRVDEQGKDNCMKGTKGRKHIEISDDLRRRLTDCFRESTQQLKHITGKHSHGWINIYPQSAKLSI